MPPAWGRHARRSGQRAPADDDGHGRRRRGGLRALPAVADGDGRKHLLCRQRGVDMLDAPVSGRPPTMTVMVGGDEAVFARYQPLLTAMAGNIFYVGPAGAGCAAKLVTQY